MGSPKKTLPGDRRCAEMLPRRSRKKRGCFLCGSRGGVRRSPISGVVPHPRGGWDAHTRSNRAADLSAVRALDGEDRRVIALLKANFGTTFVSIEDCSGGYTGKRTSPKDNARRLPKGGRHESEERSDPVRR